MWHNLWLFKYLLLFVVMTSFYSIPGPPQCSQQWHVNGNEGEHCNDTVSPQKPLYFRHFMSSFHISWVKRDILNYKSIYAPFRPSETVSKVLKHFQHLSTKITRSFFLQCHGPVNVMHIHYIRHQSFHSLVFRAN